MLKFVSVDKLFSGRSQVQKLVIVLNASISRSIFHILPQPILLSDLIAKWSII